MYDLKMLEEIKSQEERIHFSSFDYNDAYTLGTICLLYTSPPDYRLPLSDFLLQWKVPEETFPW